jgi:hypothetical protein
MDYVRTTEKEGKAKKAREARKGSRANDKIQVRNIDYVDSRVDRERITENEGDETGERMRDATAKSERAVKITISLL